MYSKTKILRKVSLLDRGLFFLSVTVPYMQQQQYCMVLIITSYCDLFPLRKLHNHTITTNATTIPSSHSLCSLTSVLTSSSSGDLCMDSLGSQAHFPYQQRSLQLQTKQF